MLTDSEKLKNFRDEYRITQTALADKLGVTKSLIAAIEGGNRNLSLNLIRKIKEIYNFDLFNFVKTTEVELPPQKKQNNCVPIRFYKIGAAAGAGNYLTDNTTEEEVLYFDERWLKNILGVNPDNLHLIFADGDSMDSGFGTKEDIKDKDLLMVDTSQLTGNGRTFVILVNNSELRVKKLFKKLDGTLIISSNNPKYKDEEYTPGSSDIEVKVIGRVVWNGSKENV